ncbi:hypothetical protein HanXRQr2_Chr13g0570061 [Helianthus annuus]|uniref:Uncharacterized protein n=1 Tax=Helianthus annuus TaxID=4232 RepID=A0A251SPN5_HELAN|nr:hypothetical protein HanXRQr2_Chr13g0570061 [Helianthus annuus]KAJ0847753.1 hypothetical protein HanPSC8_Chr13g0548891 [Helianthus annuus]
MANRSKYNFHPFHYSLSLYFVLYNFPAMVRLSDEPETHQNNTFTAYLHLVSNF